jgi:hypothetical protein
MHTISLLHPSDRRQGDIRIPVILEGLAALMALIAFVGAICGALTWALVKLVTVLVS